MTAIDHRLASAGGWSKSPALRAGAALGRRLGSGLKLLQYGQMISALNRLPDSRLAEAGLQRRDIPERARQAVYGEA